MGPTTAYFESIARSGLSNDIAAKVKEVERTLSGGHLEQKEVRNCADAVIADALKVEFSEDGSQYRLVGDWKKA